ncbi:hypothetical protein GYB57_10040 [bacterium]|nr:hypothetical protein [bacterium]
MKIPVIKKLVENFTLSELESAENAILEENKPAIEVEGDDEGEQLTHVMAAIWIQNEMRKEDIPFPKALRAYTQKVRVSIGG